MVTLAMVTAELGAGFMQTRDLKAGQGRHLGSADFQEWLMVVVASRTEGTGQGQTVGAWSLLEELLMPWIDRQTDRQQCGWALKSPDLGTGDRQHG